MKVFNGEKDAIAMIEEVCCRQRWTPDFRDRMTERIERIVAREITKDRLKVLKALKS